MPDFDYLIGQLEQCNDCCIGCELKGDFCSKCANHEYILILNRKLEELDHIDNPNKPEYIEEWANYLRSEV